MFSTFRRGSCRDHSDVRRSLTAWGQRTHDVCCPVSKVKVIRVDVPDTFRVVQLFLAAKKATVVYALSPQHHSNNTNLTEDKKKDVRGGSKKGELTTNLSCCLLFSPDLRSLCFSKLLKAADFSVCSSLFLSTWLIDPWSDLAACCWKVHREHPSEAKLPLLAYTKEINMFIKYDFTFTSSLLTFDVVLTERLEVFVDSHKISPL